MIPALLNPIREAEDMLQGTQSNTYKRLRKQDRYGNQFSIARYHRFERKMDVDVIIDSFYPDSRDLSLQVKAKEGVWKRCEDGKERWVLSYGHLYAFDTHRNEIQPQQWDVEPDFGKDGYTLLREDDPAGNFFQIQTNLTHEDMTPTDPFMIRERSEERRGGKEGRARWAPEHEKKKEKKEKEK